MNSALQFGATIGGCGEKASFRWGLIPGGPDSNGKEKPESDESLVDERADPAKPTSTAWRNDTKSREERGSGGIE